MLAAIFVVCITALVLWLVFSGLFGLRKPATKARAYPSFIAGLRHPAPDGLDRGRYCADLAPGMRLDLVPEPDNPHDPCAVSVRHKGRHLGFVPAKHSWVCRSLAEGDALQCIVTETELETGRAVYVGLEIAVTADGRKRQTRKRKT